MSVNYFKCLECCRVFLGGDDIVPENLICVYGRCNIKVIDEEEALNSLEEEND